MSGPKVFGLDPGVDFAAELLAGIRTRLDPADPLAFASVEVIVNTERTQRRLSDLIEAGPVTLLPRIRVFSDLARERADLPPVLPPLRRRLELAATVRLLLDRAQDLAARGSAYALADSLAALLGEMQIEDVGFDALAGIDVPDTSDYWTRALRLLVLIRDLLETPPDAPTDPDGRLRLAMLAQAADWVAAPPTHPVIVAGSTGSRGATAEFMAAVASLPRGAVVLPGHDPDLPADVWASLTSLGAPIDHPQAMFAALSRRIGFDPASVPRWTDGGAPVPARRRLISLALRPAPVTDQWLTLGPPMAPDLGAAMADIAMIDAPDPRAEAVAIAVCLREAAQAGQRAALITPDRTLARRVTTALDRWRLTPDDSAGRPLSLTPPGSFLRLLAEALHAPLSPVSALALLKHPLAAGGSADGRRAHLRHLSALELKDIRGGGPEVTAARLRALAAAEDPIADPLWLTWLAEALPQPVKGQPPFGALLEQHIKAAETLAAGMGHTGSAGLWEEDAGRKAAALIAELRSHADAAGVVTASDYIALLTSVMARVDVPDAPYAPHPDIMIWGTLEARTQSADLIVLGGLNEGTWPAMPAADPWLGRDMRAAAGLPLPERQIGLAAHDFQQAVGQPRVVLSRSTRSGEAPTVPARWLLRLTNLLGGLGPEGVAALQGARARGQVVLDRAALLDPAPQSVPAAAPRPAPRPPAGTFPEKLAVTGIDLLIRDPYAVYARHILRLYPMDPITPAPDALLRGSFTHKVLETFGQTTRDGLPADAAALLARITADRLEADVPWAVTRALWQARFANLAPWLITTEAARRRIAQPDLTEVKGRLAIPDLPRPFTLEARADRIDRAPTGGVAIYDYKSSLPGKDEALTFHKQLPLEGMMALHGGFAEVAAPEVLALELIGLTAQKSLPLDHSAEALAAVAADLRSLVSHYQSDNAHYPARLRAKFAFEDGDYDHLSRYGEWQAGDPFTVQEVG